MNQLPYIRTLQIIQAAITLGLVLFCGISVFLVSSGSFPVVLPDTKMLSTILPIAFIVIFFIGTKLFNNKLAVLRLDERMEDKLSDYRSAVILRAIFAEAAGFLAVISFLLSAKGIYLAYVFIPIVFLALYLPTQKRCASDMRLSDSEAAALDKL